ncbi:MAG: tetratricopeptide repeat protein [Chloroflexota bacterium]
MQRRNTRQAKRPAQAARAAPAAVLSSPMSPKAERLFRQAEAAQARNELGPARDLLEEAIGWAPHVDLYLAYADVSERAGSTERAIAVLQNGLKRFPDSPAMYVSLASLLVLRGRHEQAAAALRRGLTRNPGAASLHWALASLLVDIGDEKEFAAAARYARKAEQLGMPEVRDDPRYRTLWFVTTSKLGRETVGCFRSAGFDVRVEKLTEEYADLTVRTAQPAYTDGYGLGGNVLVRCYLRDVIDWATLLQVPDALAHPPYPELNRDVAFVVLPDATRWHNALYRFIGDSHEAIVPLDHETLTGGNLQQVLDRWLSRRNLYDDRFPVSGRHFYGRELELRQIRANIDDGRHTGIYGLRKVGKTSLLYQLRETRPSDLVVYVDLQEIRGTGQQDCAYLYWAIGRRLYQRVVERQLLDPELAAQTMQLGAVPTYTAIRQTHHNALRFDEDLARLLDALDADPTLPYTKIVITIDELEYMLPISEANPGFKGYADFFAYLRGVGQRTRGRVVSVVTAANPLVSETPNWGSRENPVFQFYQDVFLPPLDEDVCGEMVAQLGRGMGVQFDEDSLAHIYREAGGHPYITRQLCGHIVRGYAYRPLRITRQIVEDSLETFVRDKGAIFEEILYRLETHFPEENELLPFIADGVVTPAGLATLSDQPIDRALRHLLGYQIVEYVDHEYRIKIRLLDRWLRRFRLGQVE